MTDNQNSSATLQKIINDKETANLAPMPAETPGPNNLEGQAVDEKTVDKQADVEAEIASQKLVQQRLEHIQQQLIEKSASDREQIEALRKELPQTVQADSTTEDKTNQDQQSTQESGNQKVNPVEQLKRLD